MFLLLGGAPQ